MLKRSIFLMFTVVILCSFADLANAQSIAPSPFVFGTVVRAARVRAEPDQWSPVLMDAEPGDTILASDYQNGFYQIYKEEDTPHLHTVGTSAWIHESHVEMNGAFGSDGVRRQVDRIHNADPRVVNWVDPYRCVKGMYMYAGPGLDYPNIKMGGGVRAVAISQDRYWVKLDSGVWMQRSGGYEGDVKRCDDLFSVLPTEQADFPAPTEIGFVGWFSNEIGLKR